MQQAKDKYLRINSDKKFKKIMDGKELTINQDLIPENF